MCWTNKPNHSTALLLTCHALSCLVFRQDNTIPCCIACPSRLSLSVQRVFLFCKILFSYFIFHVSIIYYFSQRRRRGRSSCTGDLDGVLQLLLYATGPGPTVLPLPRIHASSTCLATEYTTSSTLFLKAAGALWGMEVRVRHRISHTRFTSAFVHPYPFACTKHFLQSHHGMAIWVRTRCSR